MTKYLPFFAPGSWAEFIEDEVFRTIIYLPAQVTPQVTGERALSIIEFCQEARSREEIQEFLSIRDRKYFREEILAPLIKMGVLEPTVPDKPTSRLQKYVAKHAVRD